MNPNSAIRVFVADPSPVVCEGLAAMLSRQPDMEYVGEATSSQETLRRMEELRPDVLVMDLAFPDVGGTSLLVAIRTRFPSTCILILTLQAGDETIYRALKAGAKGYCFKDASTGAIAAAIRTVHRGRMALAAHVAAALAVRFQGPELTPRERDVLLHLARGRSNQEIGKALFITEGTAKAHVNNIFIKLDVHDRTQAVVVGIKRGLVPAP